MSFEGPVAYPGVAGHGRQTRGSRPRASPTSRDILPLPEREFYFHGRLGRRSAQRFMKKSHVEQKALDAFSSLNWMAGHGFEPNSEIDQPDQFQKDVIGWAFYLARLCHDKGSLDQVPRLEAALVSLLQGRSEYGSDRPTTLAVCNLERISMPQSLTNAPMAEDLLCDDARRYLQGPKQTLKATLDPVPSRIGIRSLEQTVVYTGGSFENCIQQSIWYLPNTPCHSVV